MKHAGLKILRVLVGIFFVGHGTQKLFGWFGGPGLEATAAGFEKLGMRPGKRNAIAAGAAEAGGGAALALGVATPLASAALIATMLTAIQRVHLKNGPWVTKGGYEYNAVLIAALMAVAEESGSNGNGDGDGNGARALTALALGALGAAGAHAAAEATPVPA